MTHRRAGSIDEAWKLRARAVIPGGMYGHKSVAHLPAGFPQFFAGASGAILRDVDGREYIDMMCSWGPIILGHQDAAVDAAVRHQLSVGDCLDGPQPVMVELAEAMTSRVCHADWAMFAKNGTDVTTLAVRVAREATGRREVITATGSYHGIGSWSLPSGSAGLTDLDSALTRRCVYNDVASLRAVADSTTDLAAIVVTPFRHDVRRDLEMVDLDFAREARAICDQRGAVLVLDDIRCGLRVDPRGSWEPIGIRPDLSTWSKAIGNGHPLAALLGSQALETAATRVTATGSFWLAAAPMAAALETWRRFDDPAVTERLHACGNRLADGLRSQATAHGVDATVSGAPAIPYLSFADDATFRVADAWSVAALDRGVYTHPTHNWFVGLQHTEEVIDMVLERTDGAFAEVAKIVDELREAG